AATLPPNPEPMMIKSYSRVIVGSIMNNIHFRKISKIEYDSQDLFVGVALWGGGTRRQLAARQPARAASGRVLPIP
ncbi:MAG TPA: hypothetical protein PLG50_06510, partial [bacterium]|nr:hypothetical protein [bacterium]